MRSSRYTETNFWLISLTTAMRPSFFEGIFIVSTFFLAGCVTSETIVKRDDISSIGPKESIVIVHLRKFSFAKGIDDISMNEGSIAHCLKPILGSKLNGGKIITFNEFRENAFPDLASVRAPRKPEYLRLLFNHPKFLERVEPLGIRYFLFVGGTQETKYLADFFFCGGGYGGAACFGYWEWENISLISGTIVDIKQTSSGAEVEAEASGKSWFSIIGIFPLGMPSGEYSTACHNFGNEIEKVLTRNNSQ